MRQFDYNKYRKNNPLLKEGYTPSDKIYVGPPVKSGPLSVASSYLQVLEKNIKTLDKIIDKNPDITAKKVINMVLKTFEDIRAAQKSGDPLFQGDFSMNEAADYSKVDSILAGTYKRPEAPVNPEIQKISAVLDKLVSKPFDYEKLEDVLNALGPVKPQKLSRAIDMMKSQGDFDLNGGDPFYNLEVLSDNYSDGSEGVALSWDGRKWQAG